MGLIIEVKRIDDDEPYGVLTPTGKILWFSRRYVEKSVQKKKNTSKKQCRRNGRRKI